MFDNVERRTPNDHKARAAERDSETKTCTEIPIIGRNGSHRTVKTRSLRSRIKRCPQNPSIVRLVKLEQSILRCLKSLDPGFEFFSLSDDFRGLL